LERGGGIHVAQSVSVLGLTDGLGYHVRRRFEMRSFGSGCVVWLLCLAVLLQGVVVPRLLAAEEEAPVTVDLRPGLVAALTENGCDEAEAILVVSKLSEEELRTLDRRCYILTARASG